MNKIKYSKRFEEDFDFYYRNRNKYNFAGEDIEKYFEIKNDSNGNSAKECFFYFDSNGIKQFNCSEKELFFEIIRCKKSINLHIKMYAESIAEGTLFPFEIEEISDQIKAPEWFVNSIKNLIKKSRINKI